MSGFVPQGGGRPTWIEVDLGAVVHNYRVAREAVGSGVEVYGVVKADGYGLGAVPVARALKRAGAEGLCVALVEEGIALREAGVTGPIVLFSGMGSGLEAEIVRWRLEPFLFRADHLELLAGVVSPSAPCRVHLKVNTGMSRLGMRPEEVAGVLSRADGMAGLTVAGVVSHLACADALEDPTTAAQVERFS
ncbi:MAG: alanine racemase, partial [Magnetococcales bacterium]|nr:alanine racemase [Magnetococcales bacterium]